MKRQPHDEIEFEFPDSVVQLVKLAENVGNYVCRSEGVVWVGIANLKSPTRNPDIRWFSSTRFESILRGFAEKRDIPPIEIHRHPDSGDLLIRNGFHRYYSAISANYTSVPCIEYEYFDVNAA